MKFWNDKPYHSLDYELKNRFGEKVYRLALNGGMTCPNRDGRVGYGGCIFCSGGGSGEFAADPALSVREQIEEGKKRLAKKRPVQTYIAYFQAFTGGTYTRITIRGQHTRWGSCSSRGTLSFNWRLMLAPPRVLDYVVVHELCHLTHMDHSKAFWGAVERVMPDYKIHKNWLREHGAELFVLDT